MSRQWYGVEHYGNIYCSRSSMNGYYVSSYPVLELKEEIMDYLNTVICRYDNTHIYFDNEEDALMFTLKYGGVLK